MRSQPGRRRERIVPAGVWFRSGQLRLVTPAPVAQLGSLDGMQPWTKAVVFGAISTAAITWIQIRPTPELGFAGAAFVYNLTFFFPLVLLSLACWILAIVFYVVFIRRDSRKTPLRVVLPVLLLLACPYQLTVIALVSYQLSHLPPSPA